MTAPNNITISEISRVPASRASMSATPSYHQSVVNNSPPRMEIHLDRLRRERQRNSVSTVSGETTPDRPRRSSRFSTISTTPTLVAPPPPPPAAAPATSEAPSQPKRPTLKELFKKHPKNIIYASILIVAFIGVVAGWAAYLNLRRSGNPDQVRYSGSLVVNALFIVILILLFLLASRQFVFLVRLCRPVTPNRAPTLPPWLVGRPPTYSEALRRGGARGTGDVEDGIIAQNESLPKYGEYTGSTLLARSQSRGGAAAQGDVGMVNLESRSERTNEAVVPSYAEGSQPEVRDEREHETRQIEEARRLQAGSEMVTGQDGAVRSEGIQRGEEKREDVALDRNTNRSS